MNPDESESWNLTWELDPLLGDIVIPFFKYPNSGVTIGFSQLKIASLELDLILSELVELEYTP